MMIVNSQTVKVDDKPNVAGASRLDVTTLLEGTASTLAGRASAAGLEVIAFTESTIPAWIKGDVRALQQILLSLGKFIIENAHGEEIAYYAEMEKKGQPDASIRFYVSGLAPEVYSKDCSVTFSSLLAEEGVKKDLKPLSLSTAAKAAAALETSVSLADSPVKGCVFTFAVKAADAPTLTTTEQFTDLEGARILIVDDNSVTRQALFKMLEGMGCRPKAVGSGVEVLPTLVRGLLSNSSYRLVLLDMDMPALNGEEVLQIIRQDKLAKDTRVVMLSSVEKVDEAEKLFGSTCSGILTKPVHRLELREMIEYALGLRLNAQRGQKAAPQPVEMAKAPSRQKLNILLAEDDVLSQQIASLLLARLGLSADLVFNGAEAVAAAKAHEYDLIFLDMHMPIMGGYDAAEAIRKLDGERKNVPIIAMTASDLIDVEARCIRSGMNGCIIKPLDLQRLSQVISDCVEGKYRTKPLPISMPEREIYSAEAPALDLTVALPIFENDMGQYKTFLDEFMQSLPERLHRIESANRKHEWKLIEREAHTLKGIAASVGAVKLSHIASRLESRSRGRSTELIPITKTICDIRDMIKELEKARNSLPMGITREQTLSRGIHAGLPD